MDKQLINRGAKGTKKEIFTLFIALLGNLNVAVAIITITASTKNTVLTINMTVPVAHGLRCSAGSGGCFGDLGSYLPATAITVVLLLSLYRALNYIL